MFWFSWKLRLIHTAITLTSSVTTSQLIWSSYFDIVIKHTITIYPLFVHVRTSSTVPIFNSCTRCMDSPCIILDRTPSCHPIPWLWMHGWPHKSQLIVALFDVFGLPFDILLIGVCTIRHWQTPGRLVQELSVCTATIYSSHCVLIMHWPVLRIVSVYKDRVYRP